MNDGGGRSTPLAWGLGLPGRLRGLVVRHLRHPARATERFDEIVARMDLLARHATDERHRLSEARAIEVQELEARIRRLDDEIAHLAAQLARRDEELAEVWRRLGSTSAAIVEQVASRPGTALTAPAGPVVSVILPVRDRAGRLRRAVRSVLAQTYPHWQLVIVDDGSEVDIAAELGALADDARLVLTRTSRRGAAGARNLGLTLATGELVTFLDSDNWWYPRRLELVLEHLAPDAQWAVDQQLVRTRDGFPDHVRAGHGPLEDLAQANAIDLGMLVVRPAALAAATRQGTDGPFDTELLRLSDWDLVQRLAAGEGPQLLPGVGQVYDASARDRISSQAPYGPAHHAIRARAVAGSADGLRVLSAEWHFPQLTEAYIQADIAGLLAVGAEVEAWSSEDVAVPYEPGVAWRRGRLEDHIADFRPHIVLSHWLNIGYDLRPTTRALGIPHAVRAHGFDYDEEAIRLLAADPGVALHLFAHQAGSYAAYPNVSIDPVGFDPGRVGPAPDPDRRMVLRLTAGLPTKDLATFLLAAKRCPHHRFVLGVAHAYLVEEQTEAIVQLARDLDSPAEVLIDLDPAKAAELTMAAGTYLHTHGESHRLGMPISPLEAMAAGAYVLVRDLPGTEHLGTAVVRYAGPTPEARADHAAALVNDTLTWSDERWANQRQIALDHAWSRHPADLVAADLVDTWRQRFAL